MGTVVTTRSERKGLQCKRSTLLLARDANVRHEFTTVSSTGSLSRCCFMFRSLSLSTAETRARGTGDLTYRAGNGAPWSIGCGYVAADVLWYLSIGVF